jgi:CheY-like chemotaxis protein
MAARNDYHSVSSYSITAYSFPGQRKDFLQQGFADYLRKPFAITEILGDY